jgi:outer membrane protein OmpA-like peptidoglycan-associated protein
MKNSRILLALPLAATLAMPAIAQQNTTTPADQQPANSTQMQSAPAAQSADTATQKQPLELQSKEGFWGHLNPFARKKYVRRQLQPVVGRVNELDELTAANSKMINDVDSRAQEGIRQASAKASEADQHAVDAGNRAQQAQQTATQATQRLQTVETAVNNIDQYKAESDVEIRFRPGQAALSKKAKDAIDDMATPLKDQKGYIIEVQGFSSGRGQAAVQNSQRLAASVVRYLVEEHGIPVYRIYTVGMGNAPVQATNGKTARRSSGGRVEVNLLRNSVSEIAQNSSAPQMQQQSYNSVPVGSQGPNYNSPRTVQNPAPKNNNPDQQPPPKQ